MQRNILNYLFMCHRIPSRSFFYKGKQFPVCARCTGITIGYVLGIIMSFFYVPNFLYTILFLVPTGLDGNIQYFTNYESNNYLRLITGILAGMGIIFLMVNIAMLGWSHGQWLAEQMKK